MSRDGSEGDILPTVKSMFNQLTWLSYVNSVKTKQGLTAGEKSVTTFGVSSGGCNPSALESLRPLGPGSAEIKHCAQS